MADYAQAAVLEAPYQIGLKRFSLPEIGPEEGLLRLELAGVCGTDPKIYHGTVPGSLPLILGHEALGVIARIGEVASERWGLREGDRVVIGGSMRCGHCEECLRGEYKYCRHGMGYGIKTSCARPPHLWGAYAEYMYLAPGAVVHRISPEVPAKAAVLATAVVANGIQWARVKGGVSLGDTVVIQGVGPQGLGSVVAARECGARTIIATGLARDEERLALAKRLGADYTVNVEREDLVALVRELTDGEMAELVVDVTGSPQALVTSVELVRRQGTLVCGGLTGTETVTPLKLDRIVWNEVRVQGVYTKGHEAVSAAIKLLESRKYPLEEMVTHVLPLSAAERALRLAGGEVPGEYPIKVVLAPS